MKSSIREISLGDYLIQRRSLVNPDLALFDFYYLTGTRTSEALMVRGVNLDFDKRTAFIHTLKNKKNPYRSVGLYNHHGKASQLIENIKEHTETKKLSELLWPYTGLSQPRKFVWNMCQDTFGCTTHSFRHTHAIMLVRDLGFPMNELMSEMGWSDISSSMSYIQYENENSRRKKMGLEPINHPEA